MNYTRLGGDHNAVPNCDNDRRYMYWYVTLKPKTSSLRWSIDFFSPINAQAKFFVMVRAPWTSTAFSNHFVGGYIYIESLKFALGVYTLYACIGNVSFCVRWSRPGVVSLFSELKQQRFWATDVNRKWTFCIIEEWFGWNSRVNRL